MDFFTKFLSFKKNSDFLSSQKTSDCSSEVCNTTQEDSSSRAEEIKIEESFPDKVSQDDHFSWFQKLTTSLFQTSSQLKKDIGNLLTKSKLDESILEELESLLIRSDLGVDLATRITNVLSTERYKKDVSSAEVIHILSTEIEKILVPVSQPFELNVSNKPNVILVVGVNGVGKTTTIGKLAAKLSDSGLKVMLAAGDTFRAAAVEQLKVWADRTSSDFISAKVGGDAAALAYEAFKQAKEKKKDVLIIDTAGRLQNKIGLMEELKKIARVLRKFDSNAPHAVLQVLDATVGQNALNQVEMFRDVVGVTGLVMTKLDGTARGGILVAISMKYQLPVYFIGIGEKESDLEPFVARDFAKAITGLSEYERVGAHDNTI
ncbi:Signal recognition particle receptor protein FtsY, alpha subunit [Liberibacter crescens BT-1]|uniref:Signal recognition particle receptor FtsY n=2 Tax=Liberibacter crescens TaxID=1273132 RepID=L0EX69_LIBCB|nr:Signal recognition particle receptor protein FtsY, alpha subunit [Liberibacter crescens BT-1]